jgi:biotin carboxyl carrier protein
VKTYYVRLDPGGTPLEVAVEETPDGLRVHPAAARGRGAAKSGPDRRVDLAELVPGWYSLVIDGRSHTLAVAAWRGAAAGAAGAGARRWTLLLDGVAVTAEVGSRFAGRRGGTGSAAAAGQVRAPMPGLVVAIQAEPGTAVAPGQPLIIMEAMKMQMEIRATHAGVVREVRVVPGQDVAGNDLLVTLE